MTTQQQQQKTPSEEEFPSVLDVQQTFKHKDPDASKTLHQKRLQATSEPFHTDHRNFHSLLKKAAVFGGMQGMLVASCAMGLTRALVTKCSSNACVGKFQPHLAATLIVTLGSGAALSIVTWSAYANERSFYAKERAREEWELDNYPEGEIDEMVNLYVERGIPREDAETVMEVLGKDPRVFLDIMMMEELGYSRMPIPSAKDAALSASLPILVAHTVSTAAPILFMMLILQRHATMCQTSASIMDSDCRKAKIALHSPEVCLFLQVVVHSMLQSKVLYGGYATWESVTQFVLCNSVFSGLFYLGGYQASRFALKK